MYEMNADGGALHGDCPWYVERREDSLVLDRLTQGKCCYVLTTHQMGKSSLVVRLLDNFRASRISAAAIDLAAIGCEVDASQWYNALALRIARQLNFEDEMDAFCTSHRHLPPFERFSKALTHLALRTLPGPLILFVDEADMLRSLPFSPDELLGTIHDAAMRSGLPGLTRSRLVFCLFATVPPAGLWRQAIPGACELGQIIAFRDFDHEELFGVIDVVANCLLKRNELPTPAFLPELQFVLGEILERVFHWTNGHPYLTQKLACAATQWLDHEISHLDDITSEGCRRLVDDLCESHFLSRTAPDQDIHLLWVRHKLLSSGLAASRLFEMLQRVRQGACVRAAGDDDCEKLILSGTVRVRDGYLELRNRIYGRVFDGPWLFNCLQTTQPLPPPPRKTPPTTRIKEVLLGNTSDICVNNLWLCAAR